MLQGIRACMFDFRELQRTHLTQSVLASDMRMAAVYLASDLLFHNRLVEDIDQVEEGI
jgi:hypothetical protein